MTLAAQPPPTAPPHARRTYVAEDHRHGIALCLSGGGFRAALFHLGAVRRLYEIGLLDQVRTVTAASGGSMLAAFLADRCRLWRNQALNVEEWERTIAAPFRAIASKNLGTLPLFVGLLHPWTNRGVEALAEACEARDVTHQTTDRLPEAPTFVFGAADLASGGQFLFERGSEIRRSVSMAVAVSSCIPVAFRPFTESKPRHIALVDGGVHDDRAIDPVWRTHRYLLISDGGDVLRPQWATSFLWSAIRSAMVLWNQAQVVQKRWLISSFVSGQLAGTYWSIESSPMHFLDKPGSDTYIGYTPALARDLISTIRTTYDAFSAPEAAVLENHGYFMVEAAARAHLKALISRQASLYIPHPAWMNEQDVRDALRNSAKKSLLGRW